MSRAKRSKWHKRHVTIDTPCHLDEIENIIHAIGRQGGWWDSEVSVDSDKIVITFGSEPDDDEEEQKTVKQING